jgi:hypothetical protein
MAWRGSGASGDAPLRLAGEPVDKGWEAPMIPGVHA